MECKYIIIQTGGKGTRLKELTKNRPKAMVPVNNLPILFYWFQKYPDAHFIVIGDYKYHVLRSYLETFASVDYLLIQACGEGNGCGIKKALQYIPDGQPFAVAWSDLLPDADMDLKGLEKGCYVGITDQFLCSWSFENSRLEKKAASHNGVAGFFLFDDKKRLEQLPDVCSLTRWLKDRELPLRALDMQGAMEAGTLEAVKKADRSRENRCRPYNKMTFEKNRVRKEGLTKEGKELIEREVRWYQAASAYHFDAIPEIYSFDPLVMERIDGENIFKARLNNGQKKDVLDQLVSKLNELHQIQAGKADVFDMQTDYYVKTLKRLDSIRNTIPFAEDAYININGKACKNILRFREAFQDSINDLLQKETASGMIHGDGTLTNTMISQNGRIYFIDARGYFGRTPLVGDVYYDWAKLYYSIQGAFDQFNIKNFKLDIGDDKVLFEIAPSGWEQFTDYFLDRIGHCDRYRVRLIHAVIWLSLASHCWEDYDSMCLAFYNGICLWNGLMEESGK